MPSTRIDPALAQCLQQFTQFDASHPTPALNYVQRRRWLSEQQARLLRTGVLPGIEVGHHFISAPGREIALRSYAGAGATGGPTLVWLHGGGWMVGSLDTHDDLCEHLAAYTGYTVLSVHYRRTPENPFPAALDDVDAVLAWLHQMQGVLPFAHDHVLLGGDSAGGHLALSATVRALQSPRSAHAHVQALLLLYPCLLPNANTDSMTRFAQGFGLTRAAMAQYWEALGPSTPHDALRTPSLCREVWANLPPIALMTASHDVLRDEAEDFAQELASLPQGPTVRWQRAPGMVHSFARMLAASAAARQQVEAACQMLMEVAPRQFH